MRLSVHGAGVALQRLGPALAQRLGATWTGASAWQGGVHLTLDLEQGLPVQGDWTLSFDGAAFDDPASGYAGEGLVGGAEGRWRRDVAGHYRGDIAVGLRGGAVLTPYAYLEPAAEPVRFTSDFLWDPESDRLALASASYRDPNTLHLSGSAGLALGPLRLETLSLDMPALAADPLFRRYLQPVLAGTLLERVDWQGEVGARLEMAQGRPLGVELALQDVGLNDLPGATPDGTGASPRFTVFGLQGTLRWDADQGSADSELGWEGARLLGALDIGPARTRLRLGGRRLRLMEPAAIPVLDGRLLIDRLTVDGTIPGRPSVAFDGILTPVSMSRLSATLDWPALAGSVSGVIPGLALRGGALSLAGNLLIRVFDGDIVISALRLSDLFGALPTLTADVSVNGLDLETLTRAFSFGRITGRLDGRVQGLRLEAWEPVSFDASLYTSPGDSSAHFISQRAVDNISNLGGAGIAGSLSRTFLGLFEEFRYDRLGISCRLRDGVCHMGGIAPADPGYYLVTGRGIPQINIKGFNTETDWQRLLEQLRQIAAAGPPNIEVNPQEQRQ
jgi:hypothetical protein